MEMEMEMEMQMQMQSFSFCMIKYMITDCTDCEKKQMENKSTKNKIQQFTKINHDMRKKKIKSPKQKMEISRLRSTRIIVYRF